MRTRVGGGEPIRDATERRDLRTLLRHRCTGPGVLTKHGQPVGRCPSHRATSRQLAQVLNRNDQRWPQACRFEKWLASIANRDCFEAPRGADARLAVQQCGQALMGFEALAVAADTDTTARWRDWTSPPSATTLGASLVEIPSPTVRPTIALRSGARRARYRGRLRRTTRALGARRRAVGVAEHWHEIGNQVYRHDQIDQQQTEAYADSRRLASVNRGRCRWPPASTSGPRRCTGFSRIVPVVGPDTVRLVILAPNRTASKCG
jgi:hypothetical protein